MTTLNPITLGQLKNQSEADEVKTKIQDFGFYKNLLYNETTNTHLMLVFLDGKKFNSEKRGSTVPDALERIKESEHFFDSIHYSGLPYVRDQSARKIKKEIILFISGTLLVTALLLFFFFRSFKVVGVCMSVVFIGVIWSLGTIGLLDFRLSIVLGLMPPLLVVIGIPNCIFLLNKFHSEVKLHGNKMKALQRVIVKIGNATFLTNMTTATGFATFIFTNSQKLKEFGVVAAINIIAIFFLSLIMITVLFSFMKLPKDKEIVKAEKKWVIRLVDQLIAIVRGKRRWVVYVITLFIIVVSSIGVSKMVTTGNIAGDLPQNDPILTDLQLLEKEFGGVMPFEILIDAKRKNRFFDRKTLNKIKAVQDYLAKDALFSKSLSIADAVSVVQYAMEGKHSEKFPSKREFKTIKTYLENSTDNAEETANGFLNNEGNLTRISVQIADVGSIATQEKINEVKPVIEGILNPEKRVLDSLFTVYTRLPLESEERFKAAQVIYAESNSFKNKLIRKMADGDYSKEDKWHENEKSFELLHHQPATQDSLRNILDETYFDFIITGTSVTYAVSTTYMVGNLITSLIIAVLVISVIMALLFSSFRMVMISLLPNFIPLLVTAGIMGFAGIPIKPSTILIFSIAFGISVDDTIHFLAKYRQELRARSWDIKGAVLNSLKETGVSMMYTSIVLFFGFFVFSQSQFGGTKALGILVSLTLLIAMIANLVLLPCLLMSLEHTLVTKAFNEPLLEILDEEEDIDLDELTIYEPDKN